MKLFHGTKERNLPSILQMGLFPSRLGIVYLSPQKSEAVKFGDGKTLLEVETGNNKLTAFDDCKEWEVFCWGRISPENIRVLT